MALDEGYKNLALIATNYTITSNIYEEELVKLDPEINIVQKNTPLLVPLIENDGGQWIPSVLEHYILPLSQNTPKAIDALILGCTHYPFLKKQIQNILGGDIKILSQDEIIPYKLADYLDRHPEIYDQITRTGKISFEVSDLTDGYKKAACKIYNDNINIQKITLCTRSNTFTKQV